MSRVDVKHEPKNDGLDSLLLWGLAIAPTGLIAALAAVVTYLH